MPATYQPPVRSDKRATVPAERKVVYAGCVEDVPAIGVGRAPVEVEIERRRRCGGGVLPHSSLVHRFRERVAPREGQPLGHAPAKCGVEGVVVGLAAVAARPKRLYLLVAERLLPDRRSPLVDGEPQLTQVAVDERGSLAIRERRGLPGAEQILEPGLWQSRLPAATPARNCVAMASNACAKVCCEPLSRWK